MDYKKIYAARGVVEERLKKEKTENRYLRDAGLNVWNFEGPGNIGGRVRAIAIRKRRLQPDQIFIGAAGGGIWRSDDDGNSWNPVNDFLPLFDPARCLRRRAA